MPIPADYWVQVEQGDTVFGVFDYDDNSKAIWFANHNAYDPTADESCVCGRQKGRACSIAKRERGKSFLWLKVPLASPFPPALVNWLSSKVECFHARVQGKTLACVRACGAFLRRMKTHFVNPLRQSFPRSYDFNCN